MSLFDRLVDQALHNQSECSTLRVVVEKELLHHDIIREMSVAGLLDSLTFIGGTCLRACYGSNRLSEDLDFTGGEAFSREALSNLGQVLVTKLQAKYGLDVVVEAPTRDTTNVATWKLKVVTRPEQKNISSQKINIDICAIPSYDKRPVVMRNHYGVEMGTAGLIIQAQSREEILADKIVAFALRPNRLKNRDLWEIGWLKQQSVNLPLALIPRKIADHRCSSAEFLELLEERKQLLGEPAVRIDFIREMSRFLPPQTVANTVAKESFWAYLTNIIGVECDAVIKSLKLPSGPVGFEM